jgi:hypothetical protein
MMTTGAMGQEVERAVEEIVRDLVRVKRSAGALFVNLPTLYPDGSHVTVRIDQSADGIRVSDAGFAYHEVEDIVGNARGFRRTANRIAAASGVEVGARAIYVDADIGTLERAIADVSEVSWRIVHTFFERAFEEDEAQLSDELRLRLDAVFGESRVEKSAVLIGASTTEWPVSALVTVEGVRAAFQAVSDNANSINRASTAFRDLAVVEGAPKLIAFVRTKAALGPRLSLLAPGKVIEEAQSDDVFLRAAA